MRYLGGEGPTYLFRQASLAGWRARGASDRVQLAKELLAEAKEKPEIDASDWTVSTVHKAMQNVLKRTNRAARMA